MLFNQIMSLTHTKSSSTKSLFQLRPLTLAIGLGLSAVTAMPIAYAQTTQAAVKAYQIEAGSLDSALARFGQQSGVLVSVSGDLSLNKQTQGVSGNYPVEQALEILLQGTGLRANRQENGSFVVVAAPTNPATTLRAVKVSSTALTASTENTGSYTTGAISSFKGTQSIRQTPQPVTIVSRGFLDDRGLQDMNEVLQNVPGITVEYTDSERVSYFSRGYQIDSLQFNGATTAPGGSVGIQADTAVLDRVEILRGSAGLLRGSGNPSANVNLVLKKPTKEFQASATAKLGSWNRGRYEGDISGSLTDEGGLRGRVVLVSDDKEFFQKAKQEDRQVFFGSLATDLTENTVLTASFLYTDLDATGSWGNLPANLDGTQLDMPRETYLGADWNTWNRYQEQAFLSLEHKFDNEWKIDVNATESRFRMKDNGFKQTYFTPSATNPYIGTMTASIYTGDASDQSAYSFVASGPFNLFGRRHELVIGAEQTSVKATATVGKGNLTPVTIDIRTWDPYNSPVPKPTLGDVAAGAVTNTDQEGIYSTLRLSLADPLTAIIGARVSTWEYETPATPARNYSVDDEVTPYVGLVYDFTNNFSAYASYTEIFSPQNFYDVDGNMLEPVTGENYETGIKGEFFEGRLNTALSVYRINNVGKALEDTGSPNPCLPYYTTGYCRVAAGETESEGWELEISGEILPGWQVSGGYTNNETTYVRDTAANQGLPVRSADPKHLLRLFTSYKFSNNLQGLTVGGGVQAQSDFYNISRGVTYSQSGYEVYNAMASYDFDEAVRVQLNLNNLTDKVYYKKVGAGIGNYYGDPRNVMLGINVKF
ncbi:MAG: TonB-dependent siderophore receptor [Cellvibrio sp.]|uniref:TonB-dependent siderophore receptor n=1 Tax=Cellvibrio sp. TaxID=1965322 RepID=UPI0031B2B018